MTDLLRRQEDRSELDAMLQRWVEAEILTVEQAALISLEERSRQAGPPPGEQPSSLVVEALGYLGGVLVVVAAALLTARLWELLPLLLRLAIPGLAAALLLLGGLAVAGRAGGAAHRLRSALWVSSVGALATFVALLAREMLTGETTEDVVTVTGAVAATYAGALWWACRSALQQLALFVALAVTAMSGAAHLEAEALQGVALWGLGLLWLVLARTRHLPPQRVARALGGVGALFGVQITMETGWGNILALLTAAALVALAVALRDLGLLGVAAVGALLILPRAVTYFFPGALAAPLALLLGGSLLMAAALRTARRGRTEAH